MKKDNQLENRLRNLSPAQLKQMLATMGKKKTSFPKMPRNSENLYPLSSAQKRMWFLSKLEPDSILYTNPISIKVKAKESLDYTLWEQSFNILIKRHAIMRTSFLVNDGDLKQKINNDLHVTVAIEDLSGLSPYEQNKQLFDLLKKDGQSAIDIEAFPLFRHTIIKLNQHEFVLVYTSHHIISDAWSSSVLFKELLEIYTELLQKKSPSTKEHEIQFIDYVHNENIRTQKNSFKASLDIWKEMIPHDPKPLAIPTDFMRQQKSSNSGGLIRLRLNEEMTTKLRDFSQKSNVTLFHTMLSAFNILLHKYTGSEEVVVGIPLANRGEKQFHSTVGMFLNTLPHRTTIDKATSFETYLNEVKEVAQKLFLHQGFPFDRIIEEVKPDRSSHISPIFQVLFVFQNIPSLYAKEGMTLEPIKPNLEVSKYDLNIWIEEVHNELQLSLTYKDKLFRKESMEQFITRYEFLLQSVMDSAGSEIGKLPIEPARKRTLSCTTMHKTYLDYLGEQVRKQPKSRAVSDMQLSLTYEELEAQSNRFAHYLSKRVNLKSRAVAILLDKSPTLLSTIVGIHKTGAAYLPLNSDAPQQIEFMIRDANVDAVITLSKYADLFTDMSVPVHCIDEIELQISECSPETLSKQVNENELAYIIYTSGSTGTPKGVMVEHKQLLHYSLSIWERFKLEGSPNCATVSSISTDLGNTQIFPVLTHGGCVQLVSKEIASSPKQFAHFMHTQQVDTLKIVPSHLASLLSIELEESILPRQLLILGGEKIPFSLITKIREIDPSLRIVNHYGPTEATIGITTHEICAIAENEPVPIGTVLPGNMALICDENGDELPNGIIGEIVIVGNSVTRGYLNVQSQSFYAIDGLPAYKTGDLGRYNSKGDIEFLGRKDRQTKIRGYRIELDAIERMGLESEEVKQCAVLVKDELLHFYLAPLPERNIGRSKLISKLEAGLPSYLLPISVTVVDELPRLGNGKINYNALSALQSRTEVSEKSQSLAPRDEVELQLLSLWKEVLHRDEISVEENFFDLGGHSLLAIELIAKVNAKYSLDLLIGILFERPTIVSLAEVIRNSGTGISPKSLVLLRKGTGAKSLCIVHPAGGDIFAYYSVAKNIDPSINIYGLQSLVGMEDSGSIEALATEYLRAIEELSGEVVLSGWSMGALVAFEMAAQYEQRYGVRREVIILDQNAPALDETAITYSSEIDRLVLFASKIEHLVGNSLNINVQRLEGKEEHERSEIFLHEFKKNGMVPEDLEVAQFHGFLEKMIHHNEITLAYRGREYTGPVHLVKAEDSTFATDDFAGTEDYGWSNYSLNPAGIHVVKGNHITMMNSSNALITAGVISSIVLSQDTVEDPEKELLLME